MLALIIFAPLAAKIRRKIPEGYNYIEFLKSGDRSFRNTQLLLQLTMQVVIFAIQLVAGAELLADLTGAQYNWMVVGMALTPFCYTFFSGLRTSVFTDALQYVVIAISAVAILISFPGSFAVLDIHPFRPFNSDLVFEFGISSALGLIVAIFADHQQWQRAFAIKEGHIVRTMYKAAAMHGLVTIRLGTLGCLIFANGFHPSRVDLVGFEYVKANYATIFVPVFVVMAMCALISTLDSGLCAFSSLAMRELRAVKVSLKSGRLLMILLALAGVIVAIQRTSLLTLWFIGCTIRLSAFIPTISSIIGSRLTTKVHAIAIMSGLLGGGSVFAYGVIVGNSYVRTAGMLLTLAIPGAILALNWARDRPFTPISNIPL